VDVSGRVDKTGAGLAAPYGSQHEDDRADPRGCVRREGGELCCNGYFTTSPLLSPGAYSLHEEEGTLIHFLISLIHFLISFRWFILAESSDPPAAAGRTRHPRGFVRRMTLCAPGAGHALDGTLARLLHRVLGAFPLRPRQRVVRHVCPAPPAVQVGRTSLTRPVQIGRASPIPPSFSRCPYATRHHTNGGPRGGGAGSSRITSSRSREPLRRARGSLNQ